MRILYNSGGRIFDFKCFKILQPIFLFAKTYLKSDFLLLLVSVWLILLVNTQQETNIHQQRQCVVGDAFFCLWVVFVCVRFVLFSLFLQNLQISTGRRTLFARYWRAVTARWNPCTAGFEFTYIQKLIWKNSKVC